MRIYVGGNDGRLHALNSNGTLAWRMLLGERGISDGIAIGSDGTVYVCGGDFGTVLYAIAPNGVVKWNYPVGVFADSSPALGSDGRVFVGGDAIYTFEPEGALVWSYATGRTIESSPALGSEGRVYVGCRDYSIYALNSDGALAWRYATGYIVYSSPALGSDGRVYVGSCDDNIYALNSDGTLAWRHTTGDRVYSSPALGSDGRVYVGSCDNNIYALNSDGTLNWRFGVARSVYSSPAIGSDGGIYFGSYDSVFYCIRQSTPTPTITSTPTITPTPTMSPTTTATPTPTPTEMPTSPATPMPPYENVLNRTQLRPGDHLDILFMLHESIENPFTAYAVIIMPGGKMLNALTLDTPVKPVAENVGRLRAPFSYMLLSRTVPQGVPKGDYEVVTKFFYTNMSIRSSTNSLTPARASFTITE
ncbi:MAG: PQQ-binding-like beta-propeller repeat protein [bacterium]